MEVAEVGLEGEGGVINELEGGVEVELASTVRCLEERAT